MMMTKKNNAYIFLNGTLEGDSKFYKNLIKESDVYCADGGLKYAKKLSVIPNEIWGDFDSAIDSDIQMFREKGSKIKSFPVNKNFTDGELLLEYVYNLGYDGVFILAGLGGRADHAFTNLNLIFKYPKIRFISEFEDIFVAEKEMELYFKDKTTISFIPFSDRVEGINLEGFDYPLRNYILERGSSRCMSNELIGRGLVSYDSGRLLCIINKKEI